MFHHQKWLHVSGGPVKLRSLMLAIWSVIMRKVDSKCANNEIKEGDYMMQQTRPTIGCVFWECQTRHVWKDRMADLTSTNSNPYEACRSLKVLIYFRSSVINLYKLCNSV